MTKLSIKPKIRLESSYTRQLKTVRQLEPFLESVKKFKAMKKLHDLFYEKPESKVGAISRQELRKGDFYYIIYNRYNRIDFYFSPWPDANRDYSIEFPINKKSIPDIITGLAEYKKKLLEWQKEENKDCSISDYNISAAIERNFNDNEMTEEQFFVKRRLMARLLLEYSKQVAGAMPGKGV